MKLRPLTGALLAAGLSIGSTQAQADANFFDQALNLEEQIAYALIESILSLISMDVEHRGECSGDFDWGVTVTNFNIGFDGGGIDVSEGAAIGYVDDVHFWAEIQKPYDELMLTKGTKIEVHQDTSAGSNQLGDTEVGTPDPFEGFFAYDIYGAIMSGIASVSLDEDSYDEKVIKDFWTPEVIKGDGNNGRDTVLDEGYELINKLGYPRAKWDQSSTLWRSNGGNGYISITKILIAPDPENNGCTINLTALVGNFAAGFQTIGGEVSLTDTSVPP